MTNVDKNYIRVKNHPTEQIRTTTPKQENWTFPSGEDLWDSDDETQFSNPENSTLLSPLIPEATTPKQDSWDEWMDEDEDAEFKNEKDGKFWNEQDF